MQEQLQVILQFLAARIRTVAFVVAGLLLGAVFYLKASDSAPAFPEPSPEPIGPGVDPFASLAEGDPAAQIREELAKNDLRAEDTHPNLFKYSMFVSADVEKETAEEKDIRKNLADAEAAYLAKDFQAAGTLADKILQARPGHPEATKLKKKVAAAVGLSGI